MRIKQLINEKGYTQKSFAEKIGMSAVGLAQILSGKPSYSSLEKIAAALEVEIWELFVSREEIIESDPNIFICPVCKTKFRIEM